MNTCRCGKRWTGAKVAHCGKCHETFSTVSNFDRHLRKGMDGLAFSESRGVWGTPAVEGAEKWWENLSEPSDGA